MPAYAAWDANSCNVQRANTVAAAIKHLAEAKMATHPTIEYVVLVGSDEAIPFYRLRDDVTVSNEAEWWPTVGANPNTPFGRAVATGHTFSDDYYVNPDPLLWFGRDLYIPNYRHRPPGRDAG